MLPIVITNGLFISQLSLVADRQDRDGIIDAVSSNIAAVAEIDQPFPILFRQIVHHPPHRGICAKDLHTLPYSLTDPACRVCVLG